jgi:hypothetical protein
MTHTTAMDVDVATFKVIELEDVTWKVPLGAAML